MCDLLAELGIEMIQTPKCHPELAGRGIEYDWGRAKYHFRRAYGTTHTTENALVRVRAALTPEAIPLSLSRKFTRRANDYKRTYIALNEASGGPTAHSHEDIERTMKLMKEQRAHRGVSHEKAFYSQPLGP